MEMGDRDVLIDYLGKVHHRTMRVARSIPPDRLDWSFGEGKFTLGDLIRHIGAINRFMFAETCQGNPSRYRGCGREIAASYEEVMDFAERAHRETIEIVCNLDAERMNGKCTTPDGASITVWKWLRLMAEHEIHHRGQIYTYLAMLGVATPPLYGLTSEQVLERKRLGALGCVAGGKVGAIGVMEH